MEKIIQFYQYRLIDDLYQSRNNFSDTVPNILHNTVYEKSAHMNVVIIVKKA